MGANTKIFLILMIFIALFVSACTQNQQVVCNKPYTLVGNSCCLDKNDNKICDNDETINSKNEEINCNLPYIKVGTNCCLDKNNNKICDNEEKDAQTTLTKDAKPNFSINDLQSDIGKVLEAPILLTKDPDADSYKVYSDKFSKVKFLGKYGTNTYFKTFTKKPVIVIELNIDNSLKDYNNFYDFVNNNKDIFIESALKSKEVFENEFKNGELPGLIYLKKQPKYTYNVEKAKYVGHEDISSKIFFDNITFPETVSKRIAQIFYVRVNKYKVNISHNTSDNPNGKITEDLSNINLAYNMIVYCNPNLIISLNEECFGQGYYFCHGTGASHDTDFDDVGVDASFFLTNLRAYYDPYTSWAQSLIDMCDQKYQFTYLKSTIT